MAELPPGILPARDPRTHAWHLDAFGNPEMPRTFNFTLDQISISANTRVGTAAEQAKAVADGDVWPGLCWITLPDNPAITDWEARPVYWTGSGWKNPSLKKRGRDFPRSKTTTVPSIGFNPQAFRGVTGATWADAPAGAYAIDADFTMDAAKKSSMTISSSAGGKPLRGDFRAVIQTDTLTFHVNGAVEDHPGGDLIVDIRALIADKDAPATLYTEGTGVRMFYLGPVSK